jgi:hypothetical protein
MGPGLDRILLWTKARLVLVLFLTAVGIFLIVPFIAIGWSRIPFPGFVIEQTLVVSDYNGPGWSGRLAGMNYPEKITYIN